MKTHAKTVGRTSIQGVKVRCRRGSKLVDLGNGGKTGFRQQTLHELFIRALASMER